MIQGGVCGKVLSCMLLSGIFYSCRVDLIRRPKGSIVFFFSFKMLLVFWVEGAVISWVGWEKFQLYGALESQFFMSLCKRWFICFCV